MIVPCRKTIDNQSYNYKLRTETKDYYLKLNSDLELKADTIVWEKAEIVGNVIPSKNIIKVRSIRYGDPGHFGYMPYLDAGSSLFDYERQINRWGKIEPESVAS